MRDRLQKIMSARGVASRRHSEEMILAGCVKVNGVVAALGDSADPDIDEILINGEVLPAATEYVYIMLNKPRGYVTTLSDEKGRQNAAMLVQACGVRVYPVGRLDMDSEGLLIFTNDGAFANALMHPKREIPKTYDVWVTGYAPGAQKLLERTIELDGYRIRKPRVTLIKAEGDQARFHVTIHEGRNRQVRRMCSAAGMDVTRLRRIKEGSLTLRDLPLGKWRYLSGEEIRDLKQFHM